MDLYLRFLFNLPNLAFLDISDVKIKDPDFLSKTPKSLTLIILRGETKNYQPSFNIPIHNVNTADENLYSSYSKASSVPNNDEFDYAVWDFGQ